MAALDERVRAAGLPSRSTAVQRAIRLLAGEQLEADYAAAWGEWEDSGQRAAWEAVTGDGTAEPGVEPAGAASARGAGGAGAPR